MNNTCGFSFQHTSRKMERAYYNVTMLADCQWQNRPRQQSPMATNTEDNGLSPWCLLDTGTSTSGDGHALLAKTMCACAYMSMCAHVYTCCLAKLMFTWSQNPTTHLQQIQGKHKSTLDLTVYRTNDAAFFIRSTARKHRCGGITCNPSTRETEAGRS